MLLYLQIYANRCIKEREKPNNIIINDNETENIYIIKYIKISDVYDNITKIKKEININNL